MAQQDYAHHTQLVPAFHYVLTPVLLLTLIGSIVNVHYSVGNHERIYSASLLLVLTLCVMTAMVIGRLFALKAQDRAIRAEENLRHYVLTGKLLDPRLGIRQVIGLRFASDEEFPGLAAKAAAEGMTEDAIKRAVKNWRPDTYRV